MPWDREPRLEQSMEHPEDVVSYLLIHHERAEADAARERPVADPHQAQMIDRDGAAGVPVAADQLRAERRGDAGHRPVEPRGRRWLRHLEVVAAPHDDRAARVTSVHGD